MTTGSGGLISNIATGNPYRCWMEYLATWSLLARDEAGVRQLLAPFQGQLMETSLGRDPTRLAILAHARMA